MPTTAIDADRRRAILMSSVQEAIDAGARVEALSEFAAVVVRRKQLEHPVHFLATVFTAGLWGLVWGYMVLDRKVERWVLWVDEHGTVCPDLED